MGYRPLKNELWFHFMMLLQQYILDKSLKVTKSKFIFLYLYLQFSKYYVNFNIRFILLIFKLFMIYYMEVSEPKWINPNDI